MRTSKRLEYKYHISYKDYALIQPLIASSLIHDKHGAKDTYPVTSIYFDDIVSNGASDKAFGNEIHRKYRVRHYHNPHKKKLELKEKIGDAATKYSTAITDELFQALITQDIGRLADAFENPLIRRFTLDYYRFHLTPVCDIVYQREAYHDKSDNLRITFDHSLRTKRFESGENGVLVDLLHGSNIILEIKYERYIPKDIKSLLKRFKLNQVAVSKYFLAHQLLQP